MVMTGPTTYQWLLGPGPDMPVEPATWQTRYAARPVFVLTYVSGYLQPGRKRFPRIWLLHCDLCRQTGWALRASRDLRSE